MDKGAFGKPTDDDKAWFAGLVPEHPAVTSRPMFGNVGAFVNGNMFLCLFGQVAAVRLGDQDRAELLAEEGAETFEPMAGRPMKDYAVLPPEWRSAAGGAERTAAWVQRSLDHALTLPPKQPKPAKAAKQSKQPKAPAKRS
jgi:TfoX/Sxy family transcriptional regulator of competence genes